MTKLIRYKFESHVYFVTWKTKNSTPSFLIPRAPSCYWTYCWSVGRSTASYS